jgi:hypothetical protein
MEETPAFVLAAARCLGPKAMCVKKAKMEKILIEPR